MSLVVFTALVGLVLAPVPMHPVLAFTALLCIAVDAGAAGALNMGYDADIDAACAAPRRGAIYRREHEAAMSEHEPRPEPGIRLTEQQRRARRARSIAIAVSLGVLVLLFYIVTLVKGPGVLERPL